MILCFSGTGNSMYAAKRISDVTNDGILSINEYLKNNKTYNAQKNERWIIVTPTYAWRIPRVVENFIKHIKQNGKHTVYFIMTCGSEIGNAEKYLKQLCSDLKLQYFGCKEIVMPENYIAMFDAPDEKTALKIIDTAEPLIDETARLIKENKTLSKNSASLSGKIRSSIVNRIFYPAIVHAKDFHVKDTCVSCGMCEKLCPLNNIKLTNGKPRWEDHCTHCMACICHCPVCAIEYGNKSQGKPRYTCPK